MQTKSDLLHNFVGKQIGVYYAGDAGTYQIDLHPPPTAGISPWVLEEVSDTLIRITPSAKLQHHNPNEILEKWIDLSSISTIYRSRG